MKVILTGGVTGGHIYPALAIGDKFLEKQPDCEVLFIGSELGLESRIVPKHGFPLRTVTAREMYRNNPLKLAGTLSAIEKGKREAYKIMKEFRPDVVVSTGSFVSVPVVLAAHKYGAKIFIHEQNAFPGLANRTMLRYADRLFLGFRTAAEHFGEADKLIYSGNPVRSDFSEPDRSAAREKLGIPPEDFMIFVFGGSLGAEAINDIGIAVIEKYGNADGVSVMFGTGNRYNDDVTRKMRSKGMGAYSNVRISSYVDDMPSVLAASDVIIARSGALSVAEITMTGRAAIFIPSPNVTGDHQYYNAKEIADRGGAVIVHEDEGADCRVVNIIGEMMNDPELVAEMERCSHECAPLCASDIVYDNIMKVLGGADVGQSC